MKQNTLVLLILVFFINLSLGQNTGFGTPFPISRVEIRSWGNNSVTSALNVTNRDSTSLFFVRDDGKVGIGTITPTEGLHLLGKNLAVIGSPGNEDTLALSGAGNRMFYYSQKAAFRAGSVTNNEWDNPNIGNNSFATGANTVASGYYSTAIGSYTTASGISSIAMGNATTASGLFATAMGRNTIASDTSCIAMGNFTTASGEYTTTMGDHTKAQSYRETTIGSYNTNNPTANPNSWVSTDRLFTIGNGLGLGSESNALVMLKNGNTTLKGALTLSNDTSSYTLPQVDGTTGQILVTNGSGILSWATVSGVSNSLDGAYNNGGTGLGRSITANNGAVLIQGTDGLQVTGTHGSGDTLALSGLGTRMFFYPKKSAFRAGYVDGTHWDNANIGNVSTAMGLNSTASGFSSTAIGNGVTASGYVSFSSGELTTASGSYATAIGIGTIASGSKSTATGSGTTASGYASFSAGESAIANNNYTIALGKNVTSSGVAAFSTGYGSTASGDFTTAMGQNANATAIFAVAMGQNTTASGVAAVATGRTTTASSQDATAMGYGTTASGQASTALCGYTTASANFAFATGNTTSATGDNATAMGELSTASGLSSTAMGSGTTANAYGEISMGLYNTQAGSFSSSSFATTDRVFTLGNGTSAAAKSDALVILKNGNVGIGTIAPTTPTMGFHLKNNNGLLVEGTNGIGNALSVSGAGTRMIFYSKKSAFRAGAVNAAQWDDYNIGLSSIAMGSSPMASGDFSIALGTEASSIGIFSTSIGYSCLANGDGSTAIGYNTLSYGEGSVALGMNVNAMSYGEVIVGLNSAFSASSSNANAWVATDRLFTVGNGSSASSPSNAFIIYKNGSALHYGDVTALSFTSLSDKRFKQNILPISTVSGSALTNLAAINGYYYDFRVTEFPERKFTDAKQIGFIAQELEKVYPELVMTDEEGYKRVDYPKITPVLVEAIKELKAENDALKAKNAHLEANDSEIKAKIEALENAVYGNAKR
jgi:hypothetical protein